MTRPKDHLIAAAVSEIARLGPVCGTHQSFRQQVSQIVVPLVDGLAQMGREATGAAPVVAYECTEGIEHERVLRWHPLPVGQFVGDTAPLVRQADHLAVVMDLRQQLAYHESQDDEVARLRAELAEVKRPLDAQMARLNENLTAANVRIAELEGDLATARDLARWGH